MSQINIYKIDQKKNNDFLKELSSKFDKGKTIEINKKINEKQINFGLTLYISKPNEEKEVNWKWILEEFEEEKVTNIPNYKAVLLIEKDEYMYALTFGFAYFNVDKFCDRDFAFKFGRKIDYKEIKTTAFTSPNSKRNKSINTYIDYNNFEFDSGESFVKIKAKMLINEKLHLFKESIEIGNSIKFNIECDSIDNIVNLIIYIESVIENEEDKVNIPVFSKISSKELIDELNQRLRDEITFNPYIINISEIDIIGANEIFNHNDNSFLLKYKYKEKKIQDISIDEIKKFIDENEFTIDCIPDIKVIVYNNSTPVRTCKINELIDYTDDKERCLLTKGEWYQYNDDYLKYLSNSINEIEVKYDSKYDFSEKTHKEFLVRKYVEEKGESKYKGKRETEIRKSIANKYYKERYYNIMLEEEYGFKNKDRTKDMVGTANTELMDLYKDKTIFAVKIGSSSGKLCYVLDQSTQSLKSYKHNLIEDKPEIDTVAIWLVLNRANKLKLVNGKPDINDLDMLMLKNRIDSWKKEVRLLGYKPIIYVNYVID